MPLHRASAVFRKKLDVRDMQVWTCAVTSCRVVPGLTPQLSCTAPAAPSMDTLLSQNRPKAGHFSPVRVPAHHLFMKRLLCAPHLLWSQ